MQLNKFSKKLLPLTILLAFAVILLGAYTRLTNAGLGCPDWPGCYGKLFVDNIASSALDNQFNSTKAWTEMAHRYLAGSLAFLILVISGSVILANIRSRVTSFKSYLLPILLISMIIFQALLGMWTVTLKLLPPVVMGHLLGGLITLSLLVLLLLNTFKFTTPIKFSRLTRVLCGLTLAAVFVQIILGGWTSSNYAAVPCLDFPTCNGQFFPDANTLNAMNPFVAIGPNYEGGVLSNEMRVTIQLFHRWGALISVMLILITALNLRTYNLAYYKKFSVHLLLLSICQVALGIINVKWVLPLHVALTHNAVATLLLISLIILNYKITQSSLECRHSSIINHYL